MSKLLHYKKIIKKEKDGGPIKSVAYIEIGRNFGASSTSGHIHEINKNSVDFTFDIYSGKKTSFKTIK